MEIPSARRRAPGLAAALLIASLGTTVLGAADTLPRLTAPVNDFGHVIDTVSATELDRRIRALQTASSDAVVVATVETFAPYGSIEEYAVKLFEQSGIGQRQRDNGVLVVLAVTERRVRIEVGYELEEFITDGFASETIRLSMLPSFRQGRYGEGLLAGTTRLIQRIAERRGITLADMPAAPPAAVRRGGGGPSLARIIVIVIIFLVVANIIRRGGGGASIRRRGWPGPWSGWGGGLGGFGGGGFGGGGFGGGFGGGGGGFGGFGGGRSGGGGASGGW